MKAGATLKRGIAVENAHPLVIEVGHPTDHCVVLFGALGLPKQMVWW